MNRYQFKVYASVMYPDWEEDIYNDKEPFWIPEYRDGWKANYFYETNTVWMYETSTDKERGRFWQWCRENLSKVPMCFMTNSSIKKEWWGFNTEEDMLLFLLKWA